MSNPYWFFIQGDLARFFSQLDSNPISSTYGCFDRAYWHHRRVDFSSASQQQGVLVLAHLYQFDLPGNPRFKKADLLKDIEAALLFTCSLQHKDGSLDEWYPQERGWAGPTGYVLYSVVRTVQLLDAEISPGVKEKIRIFAERAVHHLLHHEETDVLSNHQAMAILAIEIANAQFSLAFSEEKLSALWLRFESGFSEEGWSREYDGCDPGYQSATLSFLSRLYRFSPSPRIKELCLKQLSFLQQFVFPDFSYAGSMGSRGTSNVFHYGFEAWVPESAAALELAENCLEGLSRGTILKPSDQEDHYLIYRLVEFLECAEIYLVRERSAMWKPVVETFYQKDCGMFRISDEKHYGILNLKKGGTGKVYSSKTGELLFEDSGYFAQDTEGCMYTSAGISSFRKIDFTSAGVSVRGEANIYLRPRFDQVSFLLFRAVLLFVRGPRVATALKRWIRSRIMTGFSATSKITFSRHIAFSEGLSVSDTICTKGMKLKKLVRARNFPARSVPQSLYSTRSELHRSHHFIFSSDEILRLNQNNSLDAKVI